ncbi:dehydrogenase/reductase SDR family member on chromosome X-like [Penaeus chinensis]|uniref:dehydrogenase/reductase SDR family member on chromosome X-like n=1 Tax=Penaeus chinensis TaxID=139456 RepID=UPI001FB746A8|nr:dehydrogenase/reductase SDR family member on chromosome X-like [Penaeus chinensis]
MGLLYNLWNTIWTFILFYALGAWYLLKELFSSHKKPSGILNQSGRVAIVTGGGRGIGLETVQQFLDLDMTVIIGGRNASGIEKDVSKRRGSNKDVGKVICLDLDLASLTSVRRFAEAFKALRLPLHVLVNNAGIMFWPLEITEDGFESHWSVNYLGHFLLTQLLWPVLKASSTSDKPARVVNLSSSIHYLGSINFDDINSKNHYNAQTAYAQSKLAQLMFTKELDERIRAAGENITVNAVHPGVVATELFQHVAWARYFPWLARSFLKTPKQGSDTVVYAALSQLVLDGGHYYENCTITRPAVMKPNDLRHLWEISCQQCKVVDFGGL